MNKKCNKPNGIRLQISYGQVPAFKKQLEIGAKIYAEQCREKRIEEQKKK